ncbi:MAG: DUF2892 domain-containing protein [Roseobacter sp.]
MELTTNIGTADRILRIILGVLLVGLAAVGTIGLWGWLGVIFIGTAFLKFCPIYRVLGVKTCQDC